MCMNTNTSMNMNMSMNMSMSMSMNMSKSMIMNIYIYIYICHNLINQVHKNAPSGLSLELIRYVYSVYVCSLWLS